MKKVLSTTRLRSFGLELTVSLEGGKKVSRS
jgi:hypothetical protein